jgi:hypothetical protein
LDAAIVTRLSTVAKDEKVLRDELSLYRRLATIESEFETQLERLEVEKSAERLIKPRIPQPQNV